MSRDKYLHGLRGLLRRRLANELRERTDQLLFDFSKCANTYKMMRATGEELKEFVCFRG